MLINVVADLIDVKLTWYLIDCSLDRVNRLLHLMYPRFDSQFRSTFVVLYLSPRSKSVTDLHLDTFHINKTESNPDYLQ